MYSVIKSPFLFHHFKVAITLIFFMLIHILIIKTDILFGEINYNLSPLKIGYFIAKDIKSKHKLTEQNYKRLVIVFRFWIIGLLYYAILYYKMRFDQLHHQIKSIIPNGKWKLIIKRREKLLLNLIHEHNELVVEIHKLNMMLRR